MTDETKTEQTATPQPESQTDLQTTPQETGAPPAHPSAEALVQQQAEAQAEHQRQIDGQLTDIKDQIAALGAAHDDLARRVEDIERRNESTADRPSSEPRSEAHLRLETRVARLEAKLKHS